MTAYVEKAKHFKSTMMAVVAKDATLLSTLYLQDLPPIIDNTVGEKLLWQLPLDAHFHNVFSTGTPCSIVDYIEHSTDANNDHHHDHQLPVDPSTLQHEIHHTFALFSDFLSSISPSLPPAQPPPIRTTHPMDNNNDNDDPLPPDDHCQPINLLALQQDIIQQTASIQTFFASLTPLLSMGTICSSNHGESNSSKNTETPSDNPMTATNLVDPPTKLLTVHQYLEQLSTTECFILACILCQCNLESFYCKQQLL